LTLAIFINSLVFLLGFIITTSFAVLLFFQIVFGAVISIGICELLKFQDYVYIKEIALEYLLKRKE